MRQLLIPLTLFLTFNLAQAQVGVKYDNDETYQYDSSMKSDHFTYLVWDRNDDGGGNFINESTPNFFYWDNDDSQLHYLIDTGNMSQLDARFYSLGIGTTNPSDPLHVYESVNANGHTMRLDADVDQNPNLVFSVNGQRLANIRVDERGNDQLQFQVGSGQLEAVSINPTGEVGIGTVNPTELLTVNGTTKAEEVIVEENVGADFVFEDEYELPSLSEVEQHIKTRKHLPEIPTAEEMKRDGVKVGELQMKLLQKIEELTLYTIELQKQLKQQKEEIAYQKGIQDRQRREIEILKKRLQKR